jgi:outer membrane lipoprotein LolB
VKNLSLHPNAFSRWAFSLIFIYFLCACVTVEKHTLPPDSEINKQANWELHRASVQNLKTWQLKGRVAGKSKDEGFRAGVNWNQLQQDYIIDLHGPLGRKVAVITGKQGHVHLKTSKGESFEAENAEELMQNLLGYSLPINGLQHWLLGIPDPDQAYASIVLNEYGYLQNLKQADWLIDYKRYHESTPALPALIQISNINLNANIKIDHWTLNP